MFHIMKQVEHSKSPNNVANPNKFYFEDKKNLEVNQSIEKVNKLNQKMSTIMRTYDSTTNQ